jgi:hypothetical protein
VSATLDAVEIGFKIPFLELGAKTKWRPDASVEPAAWAIYVEMATRIAVAELNAGHLREALASYHEMFTEVRAILRAGGPSLARSSTAEEPSLATLVLWMLNGEIRPVLSLWHVSLSDHEAGRAEGVSVSAHEQAWTEADECVAGLNGLSKRLLLYARLFERVCGISRSPIPDIRGGSSGEGHGHG